MASRDKEVITGPPKKAGWLLQSCFPRMAWPITFKFHFWGSWNCKLSLRFGDMGLNIISDSTLGLSSCL